MVTVRVSLGEAGVGQGKSGKREVMVGRHGNGKGNGICAARRGNPSCACIPGALRDGSFDDVGLQQRLFCDQRMLHVLWAQALNRGSSDCRDGPKSSSTKGRSGTSAACFAENRTLLSSA